MRAYEQKSPLNIYIEDADLLFLDLKIRIANNVIKNVSRFGELLNNSSVSKILSQLNLAPNQSKIEQKDQPISMISKIRDLNKQYFKYTLNNNDKKFIFSLLTSEKSLNNFTDLNEILKIDLNLDNSKKVFA